MPSKPILPRRMLPPVLLCALSLTGCAQPKVRIALPPAERAAPVPAPMIPAGEATCAGASCLSDAQTAQLIADYDAALGTANRQLAWLHAWIETAARQRSSR